MANTLGSNRTLGYNWGHLVVVVGGQTLASLLLQLLDLFHDLGTRLECFDDAFASECSGNKLINGYMPGIGGVCRAAAATAATVVGCCRCCGCSCFSLAQFFFQSYK